MGKESGYVIKYPYSSDAARSAVLLCRLRGNSKADLVSSIPTAAASGQTSCALSLLRHQQGRPRVLCANCHYCHFGDFALKCCIG